MPVVYVMAPNQAHFMNWLTEQQRRGNHRRYIYLNHPRQVQGVRMSQDQFTMIPGAERHPEYKKILRAVTHATSKAAR